MHKKGREKPEEGSKLSSKSVNGLRQKVQKTGIFELFWPLMSIWRMRNELLKYNNSCVTKGVAYCSKYAHALYCAKT